MTPSDILPTLGLDDVFIVPTRDGSDTLFSKTYQATYHSIFGAVSESRHVFIQNGLDTYLDRRDITVLEFGFGTGLNAFMAYIFSLRHGIRLSYTGIEAFPIDLAVARRLNYPNYLAFPEERDVFERMHTEITFSAEQFTFRRIASMSEIPDEDRFDCIFFDAFAPGAQPDLWDQVTFDRLFAFTNHGGCLVTYCAQGEVRRKMVEAGFEVQRIPGPPGKREMLRAVKL